MRSLLREEQDSRHVDTGPTGQKQREAALLEAERPSPTPEVRSRRTAMQPDRTFSAALPTRNRGGGVQTGEAWAPFINKQLNTVGGFLV